MARRVEFRNFERRIVRKEKQLHSIEHALLFRGQRLFQISACEQLVLPFTAVSNRCSLSGKRKAAESCIRFQRSRSGDVAGKEPGIAWRRYTLLPSNGGR